MVNGYSRFRGTLKPPPNPRGGIVKKASGVIEALYWGLNKYPTPLRSVEPAI